MKTRTFLMMSFALALTFLASAGLLASSSFAQENQTNMTTSATNETGAMTGNQTESGTASGIENLTSGGSGNAALLQNDTVIGSQNTSVTGGMEQEQEATETSNMTSAQQQQNKTGAGMMGNETNQTGGNETQKGPLEQLGETLGGIFGGGNQSQ
jgi:hypothetical protein